MLSESALRLRLDGDALLSNWRWLAAQSGRAACGAAIKADGYSLGARGVLDRLAGGGCRDFFVATWREAEALGALPDGVSLSVLHGLRQADVAAALQLGARPVLISVEQVLRWKEVAPGRPCDVMVDTGMNRLGLTPDQARSGILDNVEIETLLSHLACADEPESGMNEDQLFLFRGLRGAIRAKRYSLANSAGICLGDRYAFQLTRPGIALYGGIPREEARGHIRQVVHPEAEILQVRELKPGAPVGYGATFVAPRRMRIGVLNIGYADGYLRCFSGRGSARAGGQLLPVLGRISMDLTAVDLGELEVAAGDWLEIDYSLEETAELSGLSQYELLTGLGRRYQRCWI